ncbi:MAG: hypothetical protein JSW62_02025 [Thermoplasmatales archaeon]|nr:MAG: hypothetical protein JSW62_02025 [Thermoplasmatales archaeon]
MKWKQVIVGGILAGIVITIITTVFSWLTQTIWQYDVLELAGMRPVDDPIAILFFVYPWVLGFALSYVYSYLGKSLDGNSTTKGWKFGLLMWIVVSITSAFLVFSSMDYPIGFTVNSTIGPLIYMLLAGIIIAKTFDWIK